MHQYLGTTGIKIYDLQEIFYLISVASVGLLRTKNKTIKNTGEVLLFAVLQILPGLLHYSFGELVGTGANYFATVFTAPLFIAVGCFILRKKFWEIMDFVTPAYALGLVWLKIVCFCEGCCGGIRTPYGCFNFVTQQVEFPVQLVEAGLALFIFIFLLFWGKKAARGTLYPIYMIMYSATRFFSEFLRGEENVLGILKIYHILCIIGVIAGFVEWCLVKYLVVEKKRT